MDMIRLLKTRKMTLVLAVTVSAATLVACSYASGLLRTLNLDAPIQISCVESTLKITNFKALKDDNNLFYEHPITERLGQFEFTRRSKTGYKKITHSRFSVNNCFSDIDAVASEMKTLEDNILQSCGVSLGRPVTQELDRNGRKMCGNN